MSRSLVPLTWVIPRLYIDLAWPSSYDVKLPCDAFPVLPIAPIVCAARRCSLKYIYIHQHAHNQVLRRKYICTSSHLVTPILAVGVGFHGAARFQPKDLNRYKSYMRMCTMTDSCDTVAHLLFVCCLCCSFSQTRLA